MVDHKAENFSFLTDLNWGQVVQFFALYSESFGDRVIGFHPNMYVVVAILSDSSVIQLVYDTARNYYTVKKINLDIDVFSEIKEEGGVRLSRGMDPDITRKKVINLFD